MEVFKYLYSVLVPLAIYFLYFRIRNTNFYNFQDLKNMISYYLRKDKVKKYKEKYEGLIKNLGTKLETEIGVIEEKSSESQYFYGVDLNGNSLTLKIDLGQNSVAEVTLQLRIQEKTYILPEKNGCLVVTLPKNLWKINGLNIEVLEPFMRLRITYNGLLKNISSTGNIEHVQFNFIFVSASAPQFVPSDIDDLLIAKYLSTENLRNSKIESLDDQFGFEQFGVIKGCIKINSSEEFIINMPTSRSRYKGTNNKFINNKITKIVSIDEYGNFFNICFKMFKDGVSRLSYGFAYLSTEKPYSITSIKFSNNPNNITKDHGLDATLKINGKIYNLSITLYETISVKLLNEFRDGYEIENVQGKCTMNKFSGTAVVEYWKEFRGASDVIPEKKLCEMYEKSLPDILLSDLREEESQITNLTGGKGCSLALLSSLNSSLFTVPAGFVITVKAYQVHLQENPSLKKSLLILNDVACGKLSGKLENVCAQTVGSFKEQGISENLKQQIIAQLKKYREEDDFPGWAVRSSAVGEDSEELSAAGQNETFLGCQTKDKILESVVACWASVYTYQSVLYRWQHGLSVITDMAVVVQKMVQAESAGVLFTCHPSSNNPSQMVITSNFGLGESVVSGMSDPDTFVLHRTCDNKITMESKSLGSKNKILKMTASGIHESSLENTNETRFSLSDDQAIELGKIGAYLENTFGNPRDIEWGFYKGKLYLFQSRPITTLNTWTDFELSHELDAPFLTPYFVSTTANIREVNPKAVTVLTRTSSLRSMDWAMQKHVQRNFDPFTLRGLITYQHNVFLNVLTTIYIHASDEIKISDVTVDLAIFGHPVIDTHINEIAKNCHGVKSTVGKFNQVLSSLPIAWKNQENFELADRIVKKMDLSGLPYQALYTKIDLALRDVEEVSLIHSKTTRSSVFYQICTMNVLLERNKEILTEHMSDFALILSSCDDVISAEVPKYLERIAKIIKEANYADTFSSIEPSQGVEWLKQNCTEAYELYLEFIKKHGHRSFAEFEIFEETWEDNPAKVINMIQANVGAERKEKIQLDVDGVIRKLKSPKSKVTRTIVKFLMKKMRVAVGIREQTKSLLVKSIDFLRKAYMELGDQMVLNGLLPSKDLIFHLTHYEIGLILQSRNPLLITKAIRRQKLYSTWKKMKFPEVMFGIPKPEEDSDIPTANPKEVCKGTPCCGGTVQARACVIRTLDEINTLELGDILITYSTDIGWSPYFPKLSGVVTELGGLVSHGAVVAREYGLPCVVGVQNVLKYFKTGDIVQLNGDTGELGKILT